MDLSNIGLSDRYYRIRRGQLPGFIHKGNIFYTACVEGGCYLQVEGVGGIDLHQIASQLLVAHKSPIEALNFGRKLLEGLCQQ